MALATQCPHCHTTFRVAADQLKLRGGIVRCGACQQVFDGNAALIDLDAPAPQTAAPAASPVVDVAAAPAASDQPVYTLDFDSTFDPFGILPKVDLPEPAPAADVAPEPALPVDEEIAAAPPPDEPETVDAAPAPQHDDVYPVDSPLDVTLEPDEAAAEPPLFTRAPSVPVRKSAGIEYSPQAAVQARSRSKKGHRRSRLTPTPMPRPKLRAADIDEPEFVKRARSKEEGGRARRLALGAGCLLLALLLAVQLFAGSRNVLAARYPALRPAVLSLCAAFGCKIALPAQIDALSIETGELQTLGNGAFTFTTLLRNQGALAQAWPSLELTLTDSNDKALVRRVFAPRDYLGANPPAALAARAEQTVKLSFQLNQLKPSGYHIAIFYP